MNLKKIVYTLTFMVAMLSGCLWTLGMLGGKYAAYLPAARLVTIVGTVLLVLCALADSYIESLINKSGIGLIDIPEPNVITKGKDSVSFPAAIYKIGAFEGKLLVGVDSKDSGNLYCVDPDDGMKVLWTTNELEAIVDFDFTKQGFIAKTWTGRIFKIEPETGHAVEVTESFN